MKLPNETDVAGVAQVAPVVTPAAQRHGRWYNDACGAAFTMELVGERWSLLIVREMLLGPRRFNELRSALPSLSAKVLSERLETLEANGIVTRSLLPPPITARAYGLTAWGQELEEVLLAMVRWALRSPEHDPSLPFTPVSLMLSLHAFLQKDRIGDLSLWVAFDIAQQRFAGRLLPEGLSIHPGGEALEAPDLRFRAASASDFLPVFYGRQTPEGDTGGLVIEGDPQLARQFTDLFALPPRLEPHPA